MTAAQPALRPAAGAPEPGPPRGTGTVAGATAGAGAGTTTGAGATAGPPDGPRGRMPDRPLAGGVVRLRSARSELRRQLQEQRRLRTTALAMVVVLVLGLPLLYFGVLFATRDPVLNSLDRLQVPSWAAQSPQDTIISGSRWCFIDCRFRERTLVSLEETDPTTEVYQAALHRAGWQPWQVDGCPQVAVVGDYSCWTRDEYTLDLWVHPPDCAYDPLNLRPDPEADAESEEEAEPEGEGDGEGEAPTTGPPGDDAADDCTGSVVQIKMQNRVADERGLPGSGGGPGPPGNSPAPTGPPSPGTASPDPDAG